MPAHLPAALLPTMDLLSETVSLQGTLSSLSLHWSRYLSTTIDKYLEQNLVSVWWYFQWTSTSDWVTKAGFSQTGFLTKRALRGSWPSRCFRTEQGVTSLQVSEWTQQIPNLPWSWEPQPLDLGKLNFYCLLANESTVLQYSNLTRYGRHIARNFNKSNLIFPM